MQIAEEFKVYEFPRAANAQFAVFPKRHDLIADLSGGYSSKNPLGVWQVNLVRYTVAALNTAAGQAALANLAQDNGLDLDGTPVIRTRSEVESLASQGFVTFETPPVGVGRWFFCPVLKDPRGGEIAPDADLAIVVDADGKTLAAELEIEELLNCLKSTGVACDPAHKATAPSRAGQPRNPLALVANGASILGTTWEPHVDHAAFAPSASADVLLLGAGAINAPAGAAGTLVASPALLLVGAPGAAFMLPVPIAPALIGAQFSVPGAAADALGVLFLANALDLKVGTY